MSDKHLHNIYNTYLWSSRTLKNKPFKRRKNFDKWDETEDFILCTKLNNFFLSFPNIDINTFFEAPHKVMTDFNPTLKFYTTRKAIKCYTIWIKYDAIQYNTHTILAQYNAMRSMQYTTIQYNTHTIHYNTIQYNTDTI